MQKSRDITEKINSTEQGNFAQEDILGIHHVTAIASDPPKQHRFLYSGFGS
jgi:hypothetical protein